MKISIDYHQDRMCFSAKNLHEILLHTFHHLYFQVIAILDQVMVNHRVEKNCMFYYSVEYVLLELFVVVVAVVVKMDVNDNEVE